MDLCGSARTAPLRFAYSLCGLPSTLDKAPKVRPRSEGGGDKQTASCRKDAILCTCGTVAARCARSSMATSDSGKARNGWGDSSGQEATLACRRWADGCPMGLLQAGRACTGGAQEQRPFKPEVAGSIPVGRIGYASGVGLIDSLHCASYPRRRHSQLETTDVHSAPEGRHRQGVCTSWELCSIVPCQEPH